MSPDDYEEPTDDNGSSSDIYLKWFVWISVTGLIGFAVVLSVLFFWIPLLTIVMRENNG